MTVRYDDYLLYQIGSAGLFYIMHPIEATHSVMDSYEFQIHMQPEKAACEIEGDQ